MDKNVWIRQQLANRSTFASVAIFYAVIVSIFIFSAMSIV